MQEYEKSFLDAFKKAKIIHNKQQYEGFSAQSGTFTELLWPCIKYEVELQVQKEALDIFEKTILKLSQCQSSKTEDIAKSLCMEKETVAFVQERLVSKGLIKDRIYSPTEKGESVIQGFSENKNVEQKVVCVFKDLLCDRLLPYVDESPALNSNNGFFIPKKKEADEKKDTVGKADGKKDFMARYELPGNEEKCAHIVLPLQEWSAPTKPKTFQILRAIKEFNGLCSKNDEIHINPFSTAVEIKSDEYVFLNILAFAKEGNGEIICTDGGGFDVSEDFAEYITKNSESYPWVEKMLERGIAKTKSNSDDTNRNEEKISFAYKNISQPVQRAVTHLKILESKKDSSDNSEREENIREIEEIVYNIYTAFERTLQIYHRFYHNQNAEDAQIMRSDTEARQMNMEKIAESNLIDDNMRFFYPLAEKVEFNVTDEVKSFLKVYRGKIDGMRKNQQAELLPLLCLALAEAVDDENAPLRTVAKTNENLLCEIYNLKGLRDNTIMAHGHGLKQNSVTFSNLEKMCKNQMTAMEILLPEIRNDFKKISDFEMDIKDVNVSTSQKRYDKKVGLYKKIGISKINSLNSSLQNQLVNAEITFDSKKYVVSVCCSVIQQFLETAIFSLIKRINPPEKQKRNASFAEKKALECGFNLVDGRFSDSLRTVNYKKINNAVCGGGRDTLGSALIAFLILCPPDELEFFAKKLPDAIIEIGELLAKRQHADIEEYSEHEVSTLREKTYSIIKELIEFI